MTDNNGDYVKQRELNRLINQLESLETKVDRISERLAATERQVTLLERLDLRIERLDRRISKLLEKDLPSLQMTTIKLDSKTKVLWGVLVAGGSILVSLATSIIRSLFGF